MRIQRAAVGAALRTLLLASLVFPLFDCRQTRADARKEEESEEHPVVVTRPAVRNVRTSKGYVCQIHSRRHIEVRALDEGYLESIPIQEGQAVRRGQVLFKLLPIVYRAKLDNHMAELHSAEIKLENTRGLFQGHVVSERELALATAERDRAKAEADLAAAEYGFTKVVAPFDGIIDRQFVQEGSRVGEGDMLTTVSDNHLMWVYFNVPEADYLAYKALPHASDPQFPQRLKLAGAKIELRLANGQIFDHDAGDTVTVESNFDNETGNIKFRADFANPENLLRHGETGTVLIDQTLHDQLVIPQRATFEILDKQYVYVIGKDDVAHQREIKIAHELDDVFVIDKGLDANDRFVFEGVRQIREGQKVKYEVRSPDEVLKNLKFHAE